MPRDAHVAYDTSEDSMTTFAVLLARACRSMLDSGDCHPWYADDIETWTNQIEKELHKPAVTRAKGGLK